ncbi:MAG: hypothetical protein NZM42_05500 [Gemmatales bacterium]|nr:hypothetical protein [Gemmatales bacterium]MDW8222167.1 hypothetical protein [Gemmatales bacterium]
MRLAKRVIGLALVLLGISSNGPAQEKPASAETLPAAPKPALPLSQLPFPANHIVVITDDLRKALEQMSVRWVLLSPETYRELLRQAERNQTNDPTAQRVFAECHYRGLVSTLSAAGGRAILYLTLRLVFISQQPEQKIELGLKRARLTRAELDGNKVRWASAENGLALYVPQPGRHELLLEMPLAVTYDPAQRQYIVTLEDAPPAVITTLEIYVPGRVLTAQVAGVGTVSAKYGEWPLGSQTPGASQSFTGTRLHSAALGTLRKLELSWQSAESAETGPVGVMESRMEVTVRERSVETEARLSLTWHRGSVAQLRFRLPPNSTQVFWADENRSAWNPLRPDAQGTFLLRLPAPIQGGSPPWVGYLRWQQSLPEKGPARLPIGRLEVLEPSECQQVGSVDIRNPDNRALSFAGNAVQVEANRFRYWFQPVQLELRVDETATLPPVLETQGQYQVTVTTTAVIVRSDWQVTRAVRANLQELVFSWPEGFELDRRGLPANLLVDHPQPNQVRVRLAGGGTFPRSVSLEGWWPISVNAAEPDPASNGYTSNLLFALPWPHSAWGEQGNQRVAYQVQVLAATVQFPAIRDSYYELALGPRTRGLLPPGGQRIMAALPLHLPAELRWDAHQTDHEIVLDLGFRRRLPVARWEGRLCLTRKSWRLEQTLQLQFVGPPPAMLRLQLPAELRDLQRVRLRTFSSDNPASPPREEWLRLLEGPGSAEDPLQRFVALPAHVGARCQLFVTHTAELPVERPLPQVLAVPLLLPDRRDVDLQHGQLECWHTKDISIVPAGKTPWQNTLALAPGEFLAPDLVLVSSAWDHPLALEIHSAAEQMCFADRALVLVEHQPSQRQSRVSMKYWLTRLSSHQLTFRLPPRTYLIEVKMNGQVITPALQSPQEESSKWQIRIEPSALVKPVLLEVTSRRSSAWSSLVEVWPLSWQPHIEVGVTRWALELGSNWRPVYVQTAATPEQAWTWHADNLMFWNWWRFPARAHSHKSLEHWLATGREEPSPEATASQWYTWQQPGALESIQMVVAGWHAWLLSCSLAAVALGALWLYGPRWLRWSSLALVLTLLTSVALISTWTLLAILAGAWPGLVVTAALVVIIEGQRWWWERRLERLAGFAPIPPGSTVQSIPASPAASPIRSAVAPTVPPTPSAVKSRPKAPSTQSPAGGENPNPS